MFIITIRSLTIYDFKAFYPVRKPVRKVLVSNVWRNKVGVCDNHDYNRMFYDTGHK